MRQIIIYRSKTGFTQKYALWLADALKCEAVPVEAADQVDLSEYDVIVFGSSLRGGSVEGVSWYREHILGLEKKNVIFVTGAMPPSFPETTKALEQSFTREERRQMNLYYLQGGLDYEKLGLGDKLMLQMFRKIQKNKKNRTEEERSFLELIQKSFDHTDRTNLEPMLNYLQGL